MGWYCFIGKISLSPLACDLASQQRIRWILLSNASRTTSYHFNFCFYKESDADADAMTTKLAYIDIEIRRVVMIEKFSKRILVILMSMIIDNGHHHKVIEISYLHSASSSARSEFANKMSNIQKMAKSANRHYWLFLKNILWIGFCFGSPLQLPLGRRMGGMEKEWSIK